MTLEGCEARLRKVESERPQRPSVTSSNGSGLSHSKMPQSVDLDLLFIYIQNSESFAYNIVKYIWNYGHTHTWWLLYERYLDFRSIICFAKGHGNRQESSGMSQLSCSTDESTRNGDKFT